ncbi:hypothetical protein SAMN05421855_10473 [Ulvibacter litoralis]|uniref:Uncharacterized protein n=1 Tax=Ulvibacter litoralis TaxID=227084 RepID=A0A1G7HG93_9FLAO|nr:hypothetical protein SAMN05421855_10473 [Ulvibacter litoralis]
MNATKQELLNFLEQRVLTPTESNPKADSTIKKKVDFT